ncbi:MAG: peptidylprolyl isomerase [Henriciella sp.]|nr:peptidylprolyl isomerase [Henriciella sp.]
MRLMFGILGAAFALVACQSAGQAQTEPETETAETTETVTPDAEIWRDVDPENLLLITTEHGQTAIELSPDFAPNHVAQIRQLTRDGIYEGARFYRVIEAFVAQGGLQDETVIEAYPTLANENDRPISEAVLTPLGNADLFTGLVGHMNGFSVARDETLGREWLLHCPGAMAMARDIDPDTGGTEFYIVLDAQRYLDRNLTIFGRVIDGMQYIQKLKRGVRAIGNGVIQAPEQGDLILSMQIAADLPEADRPAFQVMVTAGEAFEAAKREKRVREEDFFYRKPPEVLDICGFEVPVRRAE